MPLVISVAPSSSVDPLCRDCWPNCRRRARTCSWTLAARSLSASGPSAPRRSSCRSEGSAREQTPVSGWARWEGGASACLRWNLGGRTGPARPQVMARPSLSSYPRTGPQGLGFYLLSAFQAQTKPRGSQRSKFESRTGSLWRPVTPSHMRRGVPVWGLGALEHQKPGSLQDIWAQGLAKSRQG